MPFSELIFDHNVCRFSGNSNERDSSVYGKITKEGNMKLKLVSKNQTIMRFKGNLRYNEVQGMWDTDKEKGSFELSLKGIIWENEEYFIFFKGETEFSGFGMFKYGFGILSGTPVNEDTVKLTVTFYNNKNGILICTFQKGCLEGSLHAFSEKEEFKLMLKN